MQTPLETNFSMLYCKRSHRKISLYLVIPDLWGVTAQTNHTTMSLANFSGLSLNLTSFNGHVMVRSVKRANFHDSRNCSSVLAGVQGVFCAKWDEGVDCLCLEIHIIMQYFFMPLKAQSRRSTTVANKLVMVGVCS